ncbi:MAG: ABC transporter ATP-binding protein [Erysipelotrichaceae bacterium]|nr:ABC transporter ATP-binding protein [Erysipelotrichaceae bacterium]
MKLIFKYLKPYIILVLAIIGLTYAQVQTELALPDYMSNIVTNGIQYGGVTSEVPELITEKDMNTLTVFMSESETEKVLSNYVLLNKNETVTLDKQNIILKENTYSLINDEEIGNILLKPIVYIYTANQQNIEVNNVNIDQVKQELDNSLIGLEDNYESMAKLQIKEFYINVGLDAAKVQTNYIIKTGLIMLGISLLSVVVTITSTYLATKIASNIAAKMRKDIFEKVQSFSSSEFSTFSTSSLITRSGNDITKVQQLIQMMLRMMLMSPLMGITAVVKVMRYPSISWILLVAIGVIIGGMIFLLIVAVPKFEIIQRLVDKINSVTREFLDGMLVIRAFSNEKHEEKRFDDVNAEQTRIDRFISRCLGVAMPIMTIVMNLLTVFIVWFSAKAIDIDAMTIGDMMAFTQYAMHVVMSFMFVSVTFFMVPRSLVSVRRIKEVLDTKLTILDPDNPETLPEDNGDLCFDNVCFKYPGAAENVLENISFTAKPGETVAFIGSTGSGKSTIVKLIPRLFDVTEGKITYCGKDIRNIKQLDLHDRIGFASQKGILFTGTIKSNIVFGRDVSDDELNEAIRISQSQNILEDKIDGINEKITQGGTNVSGGQKQRLSIARTLAKNRSIYIFDDSFSALDYETDKKLRNELNKLIEKTKSTVIIVAQRISTIKNADKIIVLDNGKIVGMGKHNDLLDSCKVYQEIAKSQLSEEELNYARA